jgi:hypothetical protein
MWLVPTNDDDDDDLEDLQTRGRGGSTMGEMMMMAGFGGGGRSSVYASHSTSTAKNKRNKKASNKGDDDDDTAQFSPTTTTSSSDGSSSSRNWSLSSVWSGFLQWLSFAASADESDEWQGRAVVVAPLHEALMRWKQGAEGWEKCEDFWINVKTKETAWERPAKGPLPPGWSQTRDGSGRVYYLEAETKRVTDSDPRRHGTGAFMQAHGACYAAALLCVLQKRDARRLAVPLFDDPSLSDSPSVGNQQGNAPPLDAVVESAVLAMWKVLLEASLPERAKGNVDADEKEAVDLRDKLALMRLQMESLRRKLRRRQGERAAAKLGNNRKKGGSRHVGSSGRRKSVVMTSYDEFLPEQAQWQYWREASEPRGEDSVERDTFREKQAAENAANMASRTTGGSSAKGEKGGGDGGDTDADAEENEEEERVRLEKGRFLGAAYHPPIALEEVDEEALEYEMRIYVREMANREERKKKAALKAARKSVHASALLNGGYDGGEGEGEGGGEGGEGGGGGEGGEDLSTELGRTLAARRQQQENEGLSSSAAGHWSTSATTSSAKESSSSSSPSSSSSSKKKAILAAHLTRLRAADNARVVARSPGAILGIMAQDVLNARLWCKTFMPHPAEVGVGAQAGGGGGGGEAPNFSKLKKDRQAWVDAICEQDSDAVVNMYSLRSSVFGRWFNGQNVAVGEVGGVGGSGSVGSGSGGMVVRVLDRGAVRLQYESLFNMVDTVHMELHTPAACVLQLKNHVCWRSELTVSLTKNGALEVLEGYVIMVQQLDSGKIKGQFMDLRLAPPTEASNSNNSHPPLPSTQPPPPPPPPGAMGAIAAGTPPPPPPSSSAAKLSRWHALLQELREDGAGVVKALESDLEENWHALVQHTEEIAEMVDIENPHWEAEASGFVFQDAPSLAFSPRKSIFATATATAEEEEERVEGSSALGQVEQSAFGDGEMTDL